MKNLLMILAFVFSVFGQMNLAHAAPADMALKGYLSYGASTDWNPPSSYALTTPGSTAMWWVDLNKYGLKAMGEQAIRRNIMVVVRGYAQFGNQSIFVATSIKQYILRADTPTFEDATFGAQVLSQTYQSISNGTGVGMDLNADFAIQIYFPSQLHHQAYINRRLSLGHSPDQLVLVINNRIVRTTIVHTVANFHAQPRIGISN